MQSLLSKKNLNMVVGLISVLVIMWAVIYAVPNLFFTLFNTTMGLGILLAICILSGMYNVNMGIGMFIVFVILYRFSHIRIESFIL